MQNDQSFLNEVCEDCPNRSNQLVTRADIGRFQALCNEEIGNF